MTHPAPYSLADGIVHFLGHPAGTPADLYFDPPATPERIASIVGRQCRAQYADSAWRSVRRYGADPVFAESFALHPTFGTGHLLETNGDVAVFWNGEVAALVRHENVTALRVTTAAKPKASGPSAKRQALLDLI